MSLKMRILEGLRRNGGWTASGEIERKATLAGFKGGNAGRRCRELEEAGLIEREIRKGARTSSVWYKAKPASTTIKQPILYG